MIVQLSVLHNGKWSARKQYKLDSQQELNMLLRDYFNFRAECGYVVKVEVVV